MNNYSITLVEVDEVLHHLSSQNFNKIPKDLINMISENKDKNYPSSKGNSFPYRDGKGRDKDRKKRYYQKEYRDLDDPEGKNDHLVNKNIISYDEL